MRIAHLHFLHVPQAIRLAGSLSRNIPYCESLHGGLAPVALERRRLAKYVLSKLFERSYLNGAALHHSVSSLDIEGALAYGVGTAWLSRPITSTSR